MLAEAPPLRAAPCLQGLQVPKARGRVKLAVQSVRAEQQQEWAGGVQELLLSHRCETGAAAYIAQWEAPGPKPSDCSFCFPSELRAGRSACVALCPTVLLQESSRFLDGNATNPWVLLVKTSRNGWDSYTLDTGGIWMSTVRPTEHLCSQGSLGFVPTTHVIAVSGTITALL